MRPGFTQFKNEIFSYGLKPNEIAMCVYLLSHEDHFIVSVYRISKDLNMQIRTVKDLIKSIKSKIFFIDTDFVKKLEEKINKITYKNKKEDSSKNASNSSKKVVSILQEDSSKNTSNEVVKIPVGSSKNATKLGAKIPHKNTKEYELEYKKNTKEDFSQNNFFLEGLKGFFSIKGKI